MRIIGIMKRKAILGSFFKTIERDDADLIKVINKRIKLDQPKIAVPVKPDVVSKYFFFFV